MTPTTQSQTRGRTRWLWLALPVGIMTAGFLGFDRWSYEHVSRVLNTEDKPLDRDFYAVTKPLWIALRIAVGYAAGGLTVLVAVLVLQPHRWRAVLAAATSVGVAGLAANALQAAIGRARPNLAASHLTFRPFADLLDKQGVSFPSGEAAAAFALAAALTHLLPRGRAIFYILATLTAVARLVNGAHYVSDVAGGMLLGVLLGEAVFGRITRDPDTRA